ncbi:hypothetical protein GYA13_04360 [Candidatus Kuenenbacteria bacterium]|nr:hypothetical protein [Candidatus Kuenenbacteria bacterium]
MRKYSLFFMAALWLTGCSSSIRNIPGGYEAAPGTSTEKVVVLTKAQSEAKLQARVLELTGVVTDPNATPAAKTAALTALEQLGVYFGPAADKKNLRYGTVVGNVLGNGGGGSPNRTSSPTATTRATEVIPGFHRWTDGQWYFDVDVNHVRPVPRGQAKLIAYEEAGIGPEHPDWANTSKKAYLDEVYRLGGAPLPTTATKNDSTQKK